MRTAVCVCAFLLAIVQIVGTVQGAITATWDGSDSTNWTNGANWVDGVTPVGGDSVVFNAATTYMPTNLGGATGTLAKFSVTGGGDWTIGQSGDTLNIANSSTPLSLTSGGTVTFDCKLTAPTNGARTFVTVGTASFNDTVTLSQSGTTQYTYLGTNDNSTATYVFNAPVNMISSTTGLPSAGSVTGSSALNAMTYFQLGTDSFLSSGGTINMSSTRYLTIYADNTDRTLAAGNGINLNGSGLHFGDATNTYNGALNVTCLIKDGASSVSGIDKAGNSVLKLSYATGNTYANGTTVLGGTLLANNTSGSATGTGAVLVKSGATLGGTGYITGATTVESGGILAAGLSAGTLHLNNLDFQDGAVLKFEEGDLVEVAALTFGATAKVVAVDDLAEGTYDLFTFTGSAPTNPTWTVLGLGVGKAGSVAVDGGSSKVVLTVTPEPATLGLLGLGSLGMAILRLRRSRR